MKWVAATLGEAGLSYLVKGLPWVRATKAAGAVDELAEGAGGAAVKGTGAVDEIGGGVGNIGSRSGSLLEEVGAPPKLTDDLKTPQLTKKPSIDHSPPPRFRPDESGFAPPPPLKSAPPKPHRPIVDVPPPPTSIGEVIITEQVWKAQLPPGDKLTPAINSRPRPTYLQQKDQSCVQACVKMVHETQKGVSYPEEWYQGITKGIAPDKYFGGRTLPETVPKLLSEMQIPHKGLQRVTFDELAAATSKGDPAIVGLNGQHAVVVDGIIPTPTGELVVVRDPANLSLINSEKARQAAVRAGFKNAPVMTRAEFERDFLNPLTGLGEAVFTGLN
ncbi:MAG: hypothetical protein HND49_11090 [Planctomycetes bacterium]|nr:hypothetical protein [Planctomycetota bacterium]